MGSEKKSTWETCLGEGERNKEPQNMQRKNGKNAKKCELIVESCQTQGMCSHTFNEFMLKTYQSTLNV